MSSNPPKYYRASANSAYEQFDDELVVVNIETGKYYALRNEATVIYKACLQHATCDEIGAYLASIYTVEENRLKVELEAFLLKLCTEGLIVALAERIKNPEFTAPAIAKKPFLNPGFEVHEDMQDLLMLDPIHEVAVAGWPVLKADKHISGK